MPIKEHLTAIEKKRTVARQIEGLLIKVLATEMKIETRALATFTMNPNIKPRKDKGTIRVLSTRDLRKKRKLYGTQAAPVTPRSGRPNAMR